MSQIWGLVLVLVCLPGAASAGTKGRIAGRVVDASGQPVVAATVALVSQPLGAIADIDGYYSIINVPAGTYEVRVTSVGYSSLVVAEVVVTSDETTKLDMRLDESSLAVAEVKVTAKRPVVEVGLTSSRSVLTSREIELLPVQELNDIVNLQAGVVDGHIRGGRLGEVQYQVDGVSVNNAYDNKAGVRLDRSLLEEVQVISGTFDAEYGQAMSGVVNAVLKRGTEDFRWSAESYLGGFVFPDHKERLTDDDIRPAARQNHQLTLSGPTGLPKTVYLVSGRWSRSDDFVQARRVFLPADSSDLEAGVFDSTGDGASVPLEYSDEWSGAAKLTSRSILGLNLNYQVLFNSVDGRRDNFLFRFNPEGLTQQRTVNVIHGLDVAHPLGGSGYYELSLRQNYVDYQDFLFADVFDPRYDDAGPPIIDERFAPGAVVQGADFTRFRQRTITYLVKGSVVHQANRNHLVKVGGEAQFPSVRFGVPGHLTYTVVDSVGAIVRHIDEPPDYPGEREYHPVIGAAFVQDQMEWENLTLRAGLRLEYFDARATIPSDLSNPANAIQGAPESLPKRTTTKMSLAPRLGVAYPIGDRAAVHFAYGRFHQFSAIGDIFRDADYAVLRNLQAGGIEYGVRGNPDIKPEKTVQYEIGYQHAITKDLGTDFTVFYKDIRDLLGVEFVSTYNAAEYARLTNADFGDVFGFTVALDQRRIGLLSASLDYTWLEARGNASDPRETATRTEAGEDPRPRQIPFGWDQRHTLNATVSLARPKDFTVSTVIRATSGQPYTPVIESGFGFGLETHSGRKPASAIVDLRAEKRTRVGRMPFNIFTRVFNIFDSRFFNGFVFPSTGSPDYSRFTVTDRVALSDPTRFYAPRRIEIGVAISSTE